MSFLLDVILPAVILGLPAWAIWHIRRSKNNPERYKSRGVVRIYCVPDNCIDRVLELGAEIRTTRHVPELRAIARRKCRDAIAAIIPQADVAHADSLRYFYDKHGRDVVVMTVHACPTTPQPNTRQVKLDDDWFDAEFVTWPASSPIPNCDLEWRTVPGPASR